MLCPQSVALVGASRKRNSVGNDVWRNLLGGGFRGAVHAINPSYRSLTGRACHATIGELPEPVDLAILAVPNAALQRATEEALAAGARSLLIYASAELPADGRQRIAELARAAKVPLCGANCMGFFSAGASLRAFSALFPAEPDVGGIACIAQTGSLLQALLFNDQRLQFNLAVSSGQELVTTAADYMDYALDLPTTRLVLLVLESVRDSPRFVCALEKARHRGIPVIALKLARTAAGAQLAESHTGAIAGDALAYEALFERHGVISVCDVGELVATAILMSAPKRAVAGGLAAMLDSGGERELIVDRAADLGVRFARIGPRTTQVLREHLDEGLEPINPLDAWGTGRDFEHVFETCLAALLDDPDTGLAMFVCDLSDGLDLHDAYAAVCEAAAQRSGKLLVVMTNYSAWSHRRLALRLTRLGIPVLDGTEAALRAVRHAFEYRDRPAARGAAALAAAPTNARAAHWRALLRARSTPLTEDEGYALLADYGIPVPRHCVIESRHAALGAAREIGYPLVLKTAKPGVLHKSELDGVRLGISDERALAVAYDDLSSRLGPRMLLSAQAPAGVELAFGLLPDATFGACIMVAVGGTWIEYLNDRVVALAPLEPRAAAQLIDRLKLARVLGGVRGAPPCDRQALDHALIQWSRLAHELRDEIAEMDLNPLLAGPHGVIAVDCLVIPRAMRRTAVRVAAADGHGV